MKIRRALAIPFAAFLAGLAALVGSGAALADQPVNASFETGDLSGWDTDGQGGDWYVVNDASPPAGTGVYSGVAEAGFEDEITSLSQSFYLATGETVSGWVLFFDEEADTEDNDCGTPDEEHFDDLGGLDIEEPDTHLNQLYAFSTCTTSTTSWLQWTYTAAQDGIHTLTAWVMNEDDSSADSLIYLDAEALGPTWTVKAQASSGNLYNPNTPLYAPGTWSNKPVTVYLSCVPNQFPLDIVRADRSVQFKDGQWYYSTKPTDECIDEGGLTAEPIEGWGPILVDTKAPVCQPSQQTIYVSRGQTTQVQIPGTTSDATSGINGAALSIGTSGGAALGVTFLQGLDPTFTFNSEVTMPNSTAGRVDVTLTVYDMAGNAGTCKFVIRAR